MPSTKGVKKVIIPYGKLVVVLDSVKVKAFSVEEIPGFSIKGHWSKIQFDGLEGWVFDGYLSKYPAIDFRDLTKPWTVKFPVYGKNEFGLVNKQRLELGSDKPTKDSLNYRDLYKFKNGVIFEYRKGQGDGGWDSVRFTFPNLSFEECYLFFVYNSDLFKYDANKNAQKQLDPFRPQVSENDLNHLKITFGLCEYTFERKGNITQITIHCGC